MIYLRLLNREDGEKLVFVHMPKPFAHGSTPDLNQTFILEPAPRGEWIDVTQQLMPKGVDMTAHFSPLRSKPLIEIAPYVKFNRADGKGAAYEFGKCTQELWWNGWSLELRSVPSRILAEDS